MTEPELRGDTNDRQGRKRPNRLINEVSPYLLQHAWNPVEWYAWGDEAFAHAAAEDKPVFLSIGYATCHWCHVMERESFEDPDVAGVLNTHFVSVKVDREERPDIDALYMAAGQMLSGIGGWPLNVFLTPEKQPFFAMTYMPRERRFGTPGIIDILEEISRLWSEARPELIRTAGLTAAHLSRETGKGRRLQRTILDAAYHELLLRFDVRDGGFGGAPKFPLPHTLLFLLRYSQLKGEERAISMVEKTLRSMAMGGLYDQIGSGFHRYSTDTHWLVPHFEKMLYDQALHVLAYTEAYQLTSNEWYGTIAMESLEYVLREMTAPQGGFFSAQDADSGGEEGGYYLWTKKEVEDLLDRETAAAACRAWHVTTAGNYIDPVSGERTGRNILHITREITDLAQGMGLSPEKLISLIDAAKKTLFTARKNRAPPLTDDKILADWNGLMIAALAKGARIFHEERYRNAAARAAEFILGSMKNPDGQLLHRYRNGRAGITAQAADYSFLIFGLTELYMATFDPAHLAAALSLQESLDSQFWDPANGGYFTAAGTETDLIARQKEFYDGAIPSSNSVAFTNLLRLTMLTGNTSFESRASDLSRPYAEHLAQAPAAYPFFLSGLCLLFGPSSEIVIAGGEKGDTAEEMVDALECRYLPFTVILVKDSRNEAALAKAAPFTRDMGAIDGETAAYLCSRHSCSVPVKGVKELLLGIEKEKDRKKSWV